MEAEGNSGFPAQTVVFGGRGGADRRQSCTTPSGGFMLHY